MGFLNPSVVCGPPDVIRKTSYRDLRNRVAGFFETQKAAGRIRELSVYFRDLVHGPVYGINEIAPFAPASLLKLPLAFVFLSSAETGAEILAVRIIYQGSLSSEQQSIKPRRTVVPGREYSVLELLEMMLKDSDNVSYDALEGFLKGDPARLELRNEVFQEIGFIDPRSQREDTVTVRGYAAIFRLLYNVSFLTAEYSDMVLRWMAQSEYRGGLVAGVPDNITVSHKYGERILSDGTRQLHDCGVVYYPGNPYLLCIMTKGDDWKALEDVIAQISRMTYEEVESRRIEK